MKLTLDHSTRIVSSPGGRSPGRVQIAEPTAEGAVGGLVDDVGAKRRGQVAHPRYHASPPAPEWTGKQAGAASRRPTSSPACVAVFPHPASRSSPTREPPRDRGNAGEPSPLAHGPLANRLGPLARSTVTHHLRVLEAAGLVRLLRVLRRGPGAPLRPEPPELTGRVIAWLAGSPQPIAVPKSHASGPEEPASPASRTPRVASTAIEHTANVQLRGRRPTRRMFDGHRSICRYAVPSTPCTLAACAAASGRAGETRHTTLGVLGELTGSSQETG